MRVKILALGLACLFLIACENFENPYSPEPLKKPADVQFINRNANYYINPDDPSKAEWRVLGDLTNLGELPAKNIKVNSRIYDGSYNILWSGSFLFINSASNSSYLDGGETHSFVASWEGLDSGIFDNWDSTNTYGSGVTITWEDN